MVFKNAFYKLNETIFFENFLFCVKHRIVFVRFTSSRPSIKGAKPREPAKNVMAIGTYFHILVQFIHVC